MNNLSLVVVVIALNSASQLEHETTSCFLLRHEISESPRNEQKPVVERRVYEYQPNQRWNKLEALMKRWMA